MLCYYPLLAVMSSHFVHLCVCIFLCILVLLSVSYCGAFLHQLKSGVRAGIKQVTVVVRVKISLQEIKVRHSSVFWSDEHTTVCMCVPLCFHLHPWLSVEEPLSVYPCWWISSLKSVLLALQLLKDQQLLSTIQCLYSCKWTCSCASYHFSQWSSDYGAVHWWV